MRTDILISAVALVSLLLLRSYQEGYLPVKKAADSQVADTQMPSARNTVELADIIIHPENQKNLDDFELVGISLQIPDAGSYFEPFFYTPDAGVRVTVGKAFPLTSREWENMPDAVLIVMGKYKGEAIYFPVSLANVTEVNDGNASNYSLSVELNDLSGGSYDQQIPCDSEALDVKIASL